MTQQEFEERTGMRVSAEEFDRIHDMYLAAGEMDKDEFCREFRAHGHSPLVAELFKTCQNLEEQRLEQVEKNKALMKQQVECAALLIHSANKHDDPYVYDAAVQLLGRRRAVLARLELGYGVDADDLAYVKNHLS